MGQKTSKLNKEDISTLRQETKFSARELQQWYKGFRRDVPNGQLTKEEFTKIHKQFYPFGDPTEFSSYAFEAFDTNGKGYIDFHSFIVSLSLASRGSIEDKLKWSFNVYDRDRDGFISYDDLLTVIKSIYRMVGTSTLHLSEDEATPELKAGKIWQGFGKQLHDSRDLISMEEFINHRNLGSEVLEALNIYNDLV
ncbi:hypothetical protein KL905_004646 [Ogataea polymorpha]|uniref:Calcium-binding protein NCS-1 n=1 Tax=Ogataea polymorpha TaxID=460523 RepID=A0A9P8P3Q4_9ASCO|nr:hypothetical protein KL936_000743 [Ogataea polymorpha]KAG7896088.1 hypothetical protein KL908_000602 [Ogataea polymorpha]KAG7903888.1 hypothetical protein KL935_000027 [Ogataea polymorpha]KAG7908608.1 hypothetical protein KL907_002098 [Ogataea polymorpha]KAG7908659.1 hypothetical protein KL906_002890 [Ogataea polymorpha]